VHAVVVRRDQGLESVAVSTARRFENLPVALPGRLEVVVDASKANAGLSGTWGSVCKNHRAPE
jgi:hypothetical protein